MFKQNNKDFSDLRFFPFATGASTTRWCTLSCEYLREFSKKFNIPLLGYSEAWGKLIHEKNLKLKISWHCPFKPRESILKLQRLVCVIYKGGRLTLCFSFASWLPAFSLWDKRLKKKRRTQFNIEQCFLWKRKFKLELPVSHRKHIAFEMSQFEKIWKGKIS